MRRTLSMLVVVIVAGFTASCAGTVSTSSEDVVTISPAAPQVRAGDSVMLTASYPHDTSKTAGVTWTVTGMGGGTGAVGTITSTGALTATYVAPSTLPSPNSVIIQAVASHKQSFTGNVTATLLDPIPAVTSISPPSLIDGTYSILVNGSAFVQGALVTVGGTQLATTFISSTQLSATGSTSAPVGTTLMIGVTNPNPGSASSANISAQIVGVLVTPEVAARFLQQSTFGPSPSFISQVQQAGLQGFVTNQYALPVSAYATPDSTETDLTVVQQRFFMQALYSPDQLRQRVAFALGEIRVIAGVTIPPHRHRALYSLAQQRRLHAITAADGRRHASPRDGPLPRHGE